ncbi:hypothetical protein ACFQDZ_18430 [Sulfitobacter pacificus]|uniref:hypothetical protein n=1 Tax=Sulfitobacter pacificus TaxID=1499314 RepID=UPI00360D3D34
MMDENVNDTELEALFQQARATAPQMPDGLLARVLSDAETMQPAPRVGAGRRCSAPWAVCRVWAV